MLNIQTLVMRQNILLLQCCLYFSAFLQAQNVGIGTATPRSRLHVAAGASGNTAPGSPLVVESDTHTYLNLLSPNIHETGVLFGNQFGAAQAGIIYNNFNNPQGLQFRTNGNTNRMVLTNDGRLGVGTVVPSGLLHLYAGASGNTTPSWPMVVESNNHTYVNLLAPSSKETGFLFGNENSAVSGGIIYNNPNTPLGFRFRTNGNVDRMVLTKDGRVGIGSLVPEADLEIKSAGFFQLQATQTNSAASSRIRMKTPTGAWDIDAFHGATPADDHLTFTDNRTDAMVGVNGRGALLVNNSAGTTGQVLQSNGAGSSASWASSTNALYNNTGVANCSATLIKPSGNTFATIPGLSASFLTTGRAKVLVMFNISLYTPPCAFCSGSLVDIAASVNGSNVSVYGYKLNNNSHLQLGGSQLISVEAGYHTLEIKASVFGPDVEIGSAGYYQSNMIYQVIQQ
jgi:hypothetical protein